MVGAEPELHGSSLSELNHAELGVVRQVSSAYEGVEARLQRVRSGVRLCASCPQPPLNGARAKYEQPAQQGQTERHQTTPYSQRASFPHSTPNVLAATRIPLSFPGKSTTAATAAERGYIASVIQRTTKRLMGSAAAALDRAATVAAGRATAKRRKKSRAEGLDHRQRMEALGALAELYTEERTVDFYRAPRAIDPELAKVRWTSGGHQVVDATWSSRDDTFVRDVHDRYHRHRYNQVAAARLFLGPEPRPMAILIHGYLAGAYKMEQRVWPLAFLNKIGLDVALFVLPFHGLRAEPGRAGSPPFPSSDPRITNEGFRQAMADLRDLTHWARRRGHYKVGLMGMSLGGYTTALAATLDSELEFAIPIIPLASVADFARDQGRLGNSAAQTALEHKALKTVHRIVSPLQREPAIDGKRVLVIGAKADRITPVEHARRLAHHFSAPLDTWHGGHLLQAGRSDAFRRVGRFLRQLEVTPPRDH